MGTTRRFDTDQEHIINQFVNKYYFKKQYDNSNIVVDVDKQLKGVDIEADGLLFDLKAQASKINRPTDTFILELAFANKEKKAILGWFLQPNIVTDYYTFVWVNHAYVDRNTRRIPSPEHIDEVELMIVDRKKIKEYIQSIMGMKTMIHTLNEIWESGERYRYFADGIKFCYSSNIPELPITLVVKKEILKKFAIGHYTVTKRSITSC